MSIIQRKNFNSQVIPYNPIILKIKQLIKKLTLGVTLLVTSLAFAHNYDKPQIELVSKITADTLGTAHFSIKVQLKAGTQVSLPSLQSSSYQLTSDSWQSINDSVKTIALHLSYTPDNLPFYPEKLKLTLPYTSTSSSGELEYTEESFYVYFAPYGETEIWNSLDFHDLIS